MKILSLVALIFAISSAFAVPETKEEQLRVLQGFIEEWKTHYGMSVFKEEHMGIQLEKLEAKYTRLINEAMTLEEDYGWDKKVKRKILPEVEFEQLIIGLAAELKDGHTNVQRMSSNMASLGIKTSIIGEKVFVTGFLKDVYVPHGSEKGLQIGDEIIELNERPMDDVLKRLSIYSQTATYDGRNRYAAMFAFNRPFSFLRPIEEGQVARLKVRRMEGTKAVDYNAKLFWVHMADYGHLKYLFPGHFEKNTRGMIDDGTFIYGEGSTVRSYFKAGLQTLATAKQIDAYTVTDIGKIVNLDLQEKKKKLLKAKLVEAAEKSEYTDVDLNNLKMTIDNSIASSVSRLDAYTLKYEDKTIGVIRIPSYSPGSVQAMYNEYKWLAEVVPRMQAMTDVLVIDALANGGGYVHLATKILSLFATETMESQSVQMRLSKLMSSIKQQGADYFVDPNEHKKPNYGYDRLNQKTIKELEKQRLAGKKYSDKLPYMDSMIDFFDKDGAGEIVNSPDSVYKKPILFLADHFSGSGGDMVPAIIQANDRALVMGSWTMGLGGPVYFSHQVLTGGEFSTRCTAGYCELPNGKFIENRGMGPNILREIRPSDLRGQFSGFSKDVLKAAVLLANGDSHVEVQKKMTEHIASQDAIKKESDSLKEAKSTVKAFNNKIHSQFGKAKIKTQAGAAELLKDGLALYKGLINKLDSYELSEAEANEIKIALPKGLTADPILETLWVKKAVAERLIEMSEIKRFASKADLKQFMLELSQVIESSKTEFIVGGKKQVKAGKDCEVYLI